MISNPKFEYRNSKQIQSSNKQTFKQLFSDHLKLGDLNLFRISGFGFRIFLKTASFFILLFTLSGCAKLAHLQELLTLKDMSDEGARLDKHVERENKKFAELLEAYRKNTLGRYDTKKKIQNAFGSPIYIREGRGSEGLEEWIYRYSTQFFDSEKVKLYFDMDDQLVRWDYEAAPEKKNSDPVGGEDGQIEKETAAQDGS